MERTLGEVARFPRTGAVGRIAPVSDARGDARGVGRAAGQIRRREALVPQPPGPLLSSSWNRLASLLGLTEASHGASAVAQASFGTVVGVAVLLAPVIAVVDPSPLIIIATVGGILASGSGAWVWRSGHHGLATFLGASGLLVAALLSLVGTASVGGATGILLLAAVITAGGLQGRRAAVVASLAAMCAVLIGRAAGPTLRAALDIPSGGVPADEGILLVFVLASIPCWGAYVVSLLEPGGVAADGSRP